MEMVENAGAIVGLMLTLFGAISGLIYWFDKRQKATAQSAVREAKGQSNMISAKVDEVEEDVGRVAKDVLSLRRDFSALDSRIHSMERSMETVVRVKDFAELNAQFQHHAGSVNSDLRGIKGMLDSIHRSALRAADKRNEE